MELFQTLLRPHRMDEKNEEKALTWADIKAFANSLNEEQLAQPMMFTGEEFGGRIYAVETIAEDAICPADYMEGISQYQEEMTPEELAGEPRVAFKGQLFLSADKDKKLTAI